MRFEEVPELQVDIDGDVLTLRVTPNHKYESSKSQPTATCTHGANLSCGPCTCVQTAATAPTTPAAAGQQTSLPLELMNSQVPQQAHCPCGDKCSCDPCNCRSTVTSQLGAAPVHNRSDTCKRQQLKEARQPEDGEAETEDQHASVASCATWHAAERARRFQKRAIQIPKTADTSSVAASYTDGVLRVTFRKVPGLSRKKTVVVA
jgi:Hsp20/alpha crystallin family